MRTAATPAYESCYWPDQDAENRRWIAALEPKLAAHEKNISDRFSALYQTSWTRAT